jgi:hypothetical protein
LLNLYLQRLNESVSSEESPPKSYSPSEPGSNETQAVQMR